MFRPTKVIDPKTPNKMCEEVNQNIQVFVRCRPLNSNEKKGLIELIPEKRAIRTVQQNKLYAFDNVFDAKAKQLDVYLSVVEPLVEQVIEGYNCTVFAYGQTGTGKTYTMVGDRTDNQISWEDDPLSGIIPRAIDQLIEDLQHQNTEYTIRVSFLELYNEEAYDLLSPQSDTTKLRIYNDTERKGSVIISGLVELMVKTKTEIFEILEKGSLKRQTAPTLMNACSSRSHSIFSITVHIKEITLDGEEVVKMGKLNLVDLAGSENIGRSGAVEERAREASNINKSLLTLGRVITSLVEKSSHIPYRDSKLTRLLQDSLGGKTKTSIIATISPCADDLEDTISTLDYAQRAKKITNKPEINLKMSKKTLINEYLNEIDKLRRDLEAARDKKGIYVDAKNYAFMEDTLKKQEQDLEMKEARIEMMKQDINKYSSLLSEASENLNIKCQELENTRKQLEELSVYLKNVKKNLKETQKEVENCKKIIQAHRNTEEKLLKKAESIVNVTNKCVDDNQKLQEKVDTLTSLEDYNANSFQDLQSKFCDQINKIANLNVVLCSTFLNGYNSINEMIQLKKKIISEKGDELKISTNTINEKIEIFSQQFRELFKNNNNGLVQMNLNFQILFDDFKRSIMNDFKFFSEIFLINQKKNIDILDELYFESVQNRTAQEESIMGNITELNSFSLNLIQMIKSFENDYKKLYEQKCKENEKLKNEITELKGKIEKDVEMVKHLRTISENINNVASTYQNNIGLFTNSLVNIQSQVDTLSKNDLESRDNLSFKCNEMIDSIEKNKKEISSVLSALDEQNSQSCQKSILKYDEVKKCNDNFTEHYKKFQNNCEANMDAIFLNVGKNINSIKEKTLKTYVNEIELTKNFETESLNLINSNYLIANNISVCFGETVNETLNKFEEINSYCEALKISSQIELQETKKMVENPESNYKKYHCSGTTPKRCHYLYPKTFTPTSPYERIVSRFRNSKQENIDSGDEDLDQTGENENDSNKMIKNNNVPMSENKLDQTFLSDKTFTISNKQLLKEKNDFI